MNVYYVIVRIVSNKVGNAILFYNKDSEREPFNYDLEAATKYKEKFKAFMDLPKLEGCYNIMQIYHNE